MSTVADERVIINSHPSSHGLSTVSVLILLIVLSLELALSIRRELPAQPERGAHFEQVPDGHVLSLEEPGDRRVGDAGPPCERPSQARP